MSGTKKKGARQAQLKAKGLDAVLREVCEGKSIKEIAQSFDPPMYGGQLLTWIQAQPNGPELYARARESRAHLFADQVIEISDEPVPLTMQGAMDSAAVANKKLRADNRKWAAAKMNPKDYGDKQQIDVNDVTELSDEQRLLRIATLLAKGRPS